MKKYYNFILLLMLCFFCGCEEAAIDPLTGKYPVPESYELTTLSGQEVAKMSNGNRTFSLKMSGTGGTLSIDFIGKEYYLTAQSYTKDDSGQTLGTYSNGIWSGNNSTGVALASGIIKVEKSDNNYSISGVVTLADNTVIKIAYHGEIIYEPDPETANGDYYFEDVVSDVTSYDWSTGVVSVIEGVKYHTIKLYDNDANFIASFEAVTDENAASVAGVYAIADSPQQALLMNNGWDGTAYGMGIGGTTLMQDGTQWLVKSGSIQVVNDNGIWSFAGTNLSTVSTTGVAGPTNFLLENVVKK